MTQAQPASSSTRSLPLPLKLAQAGLNTLGRVAPPLAGRWALDLFSTPPRYQEPAREAEVLRDAERFSVPFQGIELAAYSWGPPEGSPAILLVHGWAGRGGQLGSFVAPLVAAGHRVIAFDAPAHGRTPGRRTNALGVGASILRMGEAVGPFRAVVAHSFGAACSTLALSEGLAAEKVVYLAPACHIEQAVRGFARQFGLSWPVEYSLREEMERNFGTGVWYRFSATRAARELKLPALIVHDIGDDEVPYREGQSLAHAWPGARLVVTSSLGHRRILRDEGVIRDAVEFINGPQAAH